MFLNNLSPFPNLHQKLWQTTFSKTQWPLALLPPQLLSDTYQTELMKKVAATEHTSIRLVKLKRTAFRTGTFASDQSRTDSYFWWRATREYLQLERHFIQPGTWISPLFLIYTRTKRNLWWYFCNNWQRNSYILFWASQRMRRKCLYVETDMDCIRLEWIVSCSYSTISRCYRNVFRWIGLYVWKS